MFDKFGAIENVQEFNALAEFLLNEGDWQSLYVLAEENGIEKDLVDMYTKGEIMDLADVASFAVGKIDMEEKELKTAEIMLDWIEYVRGLIYTADGMAVAVRRKDKTLAGMIAELLKWSFKNQIEIPAEIKKAAGVNAGKVTLGIPGMATAKRIIREYYGV